MNLTEKKESPGSKLYTGFSLMEAIAFNVTREELAKLKGYEIKPPEEGKDAPKEFEYEGKDTNGNEYIDIVMQMKSCTHADTPIMSHRIRLVDKDVVSEKEENGVKTIKYQWVNQQGYSCWCDDEKNLLDSFKKVQKKIYKDKVLVSTENLGDSNYRKAVQGEADFYNLFQAWMDGVAYEDKDSVTTDILIDKKKAFRNVDKWVDSELKPLLTDHRAKRFNALTIVGISEKDGKVNHFQNVYRTFWPNGTWSGWKFKGMLSSITTGDWNINKNTIKAYDYFVSSLKTSAFTLGWIKLFSAAEHISATNETFKPAVDNTDIVDTNY